MSIRIALDDPPEFYTNLDYLRGGVILSLNRAESISNIIVKLEGESRTALAIPETDPGYGIPMKTTNPHGQNVATETHKLLYQVKQVFPDPMTQPGPMSAMLDPGTHRFGFSFKLPLNNICGNPQAMASLNGVALAPGNTGMGGSGGFGPFGGSGAFRIMDGNKQLILKHVRSTLPPSLTGFPQEAEIRYFIKVTIQRPGFFKENWRYQIGFKFLPVEPPRPPSSTQEAYARRPFTFKPRTPMADSVSTPKLGSSRPSFASSNPFFRRSFHASTSSLDITSSELTPPSIEMSARLPYPSILTCNQPVPLRLISKKLVPSKEQLFLVSLEIALLGFTNIRVAELHHTEATRWVLCIAHDISIPLGDASSDPFDKEFVVPDILWANRRLPNTVAPSFTSCALSRRYEIEIKLGVSWNQASQHKKSKAGVPYPQVLYLPLKISNVEIYSGITPPAELLRTATQRPMRPPHSQSHPHLQQQYQQHAPNLPPRRPSAPHDPQQQRPAQAPVVNDPLYPPQLGPSGVDPNDAPPSYDEAVAQNLTAPSERPAYSGVTAENAPSTVPDKNAP